MKRIVKPPQDLNSLLKKANGTMADFSAKAQSFIILEDIIRQICPDLPENAWQIANCRENLVVIEAKSPVWGQRLQFERNNISQQLAMQTQGIFNRIEIKINPHNNRRVAVKEPVKENKSMSSKTAEQINNVAQNAPPGLKEVLLRLARHGKK